MHGSLLSSLRPWIVLVVALVVLFLAVWTRVPVPVRALLGVSVGAPEVSHWILTIAVAAGAAAMVDLRRRRRAKVAVLALVPSMILLGAVPAQIPTTIRAFDRAFEEALGRDYADRISADARRRMRSAPVALVDLFRGLPGDGVTVTRNLAFAVYGDETVTLDVYRPSGTDILPAVIQIHGGNWPRAYSGFEGTITRALAASGYVVFDINYRAAPRWRWPAQMDDVTSAIAWISANAGGYQADLDRSVFVGRSVGALLAFRAAATGTRMRPRGIVALYSPVDLIAAYASPPVPDILDVRARCEAFLGAGPNQLASVYRDLSPITHAAEPHPPVLLINGGRDPLVTRAEAGRLLAKLKTSGVAMLLTLPWGNHGFDSIAYGPSIQLTLFYMERFIAWALAPAPAQPS